jgi:hypothetical protein
MADHIRSSNNIPILSSSSLSSSSVTPIQILEQPQQQPPSSSLSLQNNNNNNNNQQASTAMSDIMTIQNGGCYAHVTFRVRCETLGHGEEVFLIILDHNNNYMNHNNNSTDQPVSGKVRIFCMHSMSVKTFPS